MARDIKRVLMNSAQLYLGASGDFDDLSNIETLLESSKNKILGISEDGITVKIAVDKRDIAFAGKLDRAIKGNETIISWSGSVEGTILALSDELLEASLMNKGSDIGTTSKLTQFNLQGVGFIPDEKYYDLLVLGKTHENKPAILVVKNTYNESFELETKDKEDGKVKVVFNSHYDDIDSDTPPFKLYLPSTTV